MEVQVLSSAPKRQLDISYKSDKIFLRVSLVGTNPYEKFAH